MPLHVLFDLQNEYNLNGGRVCQVVEKSARHHPAILM
jgi:hypothetical protein